MDFMNLNQAAHGDREHGFIGARLRKPRKIIAGYRPDEKVHKRLSDWMKAAVGVAVSKEMKVMRFGDNMGEVAVTEGGARFLDGEGVTDLNEGRPVFARTPNAKFTRANFMRTHLLSALATLKIGLDILTQTEQV